MRKAVFPGSFDPITLGHRDIVMRALPLFDEIIIAVGQNASKNYMFDIDKRIELIKQTFDGIQSIKVEHYQGLTVDFCKSKNARFILRGLRNPADFEFEKTIAQTNRELYKDVETVLILTDVRYAYISSSIVRDVLRHGGDYRSFVPENLKLR